MLSSRLASFLSALRVPQGVAAGRPLRVLGWQRRVLELFDTPGDVAASVARRGGKSVFSAGLACASIDGPLAIPSADNIITASSFAQGTVIFRFVLRLMGDRLADRRRWRVLDSQNKASIEDRETGTRLLVIGNQPQRAHGLAIGTAIADELAQWDPGKRDKMLAVLRTSAGTIPGSRLIAIGTRPSDPGHPFQRMLDGPRGISFSPDPEADPFDPATWAAANPSIGEPEFAELEATIAREAEAARTDPLLLAGFNSLRLNLGTPEGLEANLIDAADWQRIEVGDPPRSGPYVLGLDLGSGAAMSAAAAYFPETGGLDAIAIFPELPVLAERGIRDGVGGLYCDIATGGDLLLAGQRVADVGALLQEALHRWGRPAVVVCDRWRRSELVQELEAVGFPMAELVTRGQGFKDGGEDVRRFRSACLGGRVSPRRSLLIRGAMREARVIGDPAGSFKLAKESQGGRRKRARDDVAAAAILAVAEGDRRAGSGPVEGDGGSLRIVVAR